MEEFAEKIGKDVFDKLFLLTGVSTGTIDLFKLGETDK
jgi:hypothetical protein